MADKEQKHGVAAILRAFSGLDSAKELFSELNYDIARGTISRQGWGSKLAREALANDPQIIAAHEDFQIIYGKLASKRLLISHQRAIVNTLLREHPYSLFVFSTQDEAQWHFVNVKLATKQDDEPNKDAKKRRLFRRITIRQNEKRLRTAIDRLSMLDLAVIQPELFGIPPLTIQSQHDEAFDVEEVTKEFYKAYENLFKEDLKKNLEGQTADGRWAHDYALQFLNRTMFLYFVQRKGWLGGDGEFLETFWKAYNNSSQPKDTFFDKWLKVLFFEAFNNNKNLLNTEQREYLPQEIRTILWEAPYLNGGLFKLNMLDTKHDFSISDQLFGRIFNFFQQYNFTITEDSPLDKEVAVDPEMIGKVYESLVNLTETGMERSAAGIFYTPRTEIDLMCRLSLVDNLTNHLGQQHKNLFYNAIFSLDQEDKEQADIALSEAKLWPDVEKRLNEITVLDPACGSGSFLVGMLHVLNDLLSRAQHQQGKERDSYQRKKDIIGRTLYGVDVMDWACHVAELRLWLALIVDADFTKEELIVRSEPLLPHFSFKIRCGESLVQEVGSVDMAHRRGVMELSDNIKRRLAELKREKNKFYGSDPTCKFKTVESLESEEVVVFRDLLQDRINTVDLETKKLMRLQAERGARQISLLTGKEEGPAKQYTLEREKRERQIGFLMEEKQQVEAVLENVRDRTTVPFVWDISFAEIFSGDSLGFDIVIGNPPYVRQESIADPMLDRDEITKENKKQYKAKLARSVYKEYPRFFGYKKTATKETVAHKINAKSDLYIYFYFLSLSLLNKNGSFCFITSNSWLDVGYGKDLQEFLLKRCHAKLVIDNKAKRSFKEADINTVIVLFGAPADSKTSDNVALDKTARFVMFYVPFEEALHPVVFEEIAEFTKKTFRPEYRVFPVKQADLLTDGCEIAKEVETKKSRGPLIKTAKYIGNKWGGKYLRAPDIYWTILEKGRDKLVRLGDIAEVRFGIKTGCNEFFYLTKQQFIELGIEKRYIKPLIKTPRDCPSVHIRPEHLNTYVFWCREDKRSLKGTNALKYIKQGEKHGFHKLPSLQGRQFWYELPIVQSKMLWWKSIGERYCCFWNPENFFADQRNYPIKCEDKMVFPLLLALNSTFDRLFLEIGSREMTGAYTIIELSVEAVQRKLTIHPEILTNNPKWAEMKKVFSEMIERPISNLNKELQEKDRRFIDVCIARELGLDESDVDELYSTLLSLVYGRLEKSTSLHSN